jgi:hypothetical protein
MDNMGDIPGPTLVEGIEEVYNEVRKTHNGYAETKKLVTEICSHEYYKAPSGVFQDGYKGSFGSAMGWIGCLGCGQKDHLVDKVIRRLESGKSRDD